MRGKFITIDGIDGSGKSTQIDFIRSWFSDKNIPLIVTREPGGTKLGEYIRSQLLDIDIGLSLKTEILLFFAARQQHLQELIFPSLERGEWVLSDRFTDATYAYQGAGRGFSVEQIKLLEDWVQEDFRPDLTIILDTSVEISHVRILSENKDRIEREAKQFFENVRQEYLNLAKSDVDRYKVVRGEQSMQQISNDIANILESFLYK